MGAKGMNARKKAKRRAHAASNKVQSDLAAANVEAAQGQRDRIRKAAGR